MNPVYFFLALLFLLQICSKEEAERVDCAGIACTLNYVSIEIEVRDASGAGIPLDEFSVTDLSSGEDLTRPVTPEEMQRYREMARYPLYGDEFRERHPLGEDIIVFRGYINGAEEVQAEYVVGADCCHVYLVSGETELIIE